MNTSRPTGRCLRPGDQREGSGVPPGLGARDDSSGREGPGMALDFSAFSSPPEERKLKSLRLCHSRTLTAASEGNSLFSPPSPPSATLLTQSDSKNIKSKADHCPHKLRAVPPYRKRFSPER